MEENRGKIEGLVVSCLLQDLSLINEFPLKSDSFEMDKTKFFFEIAEGMAKGYKVVDELSVGTFLGMSSSLTRSYEQYGGYESIKKCMELANILNFEKYVDDLFKLNLIKDLTENKGFNIKKKINVDGIEVRPKDLFVDFTSEQIYEFYNMLLTDASVNANSKDYKPEDLFYTEDEIKNIKSGKKNTSAAFDTIMTWEDENGNSKSKQAFRNLNSILDGVSHSNGIMLYGAGSGGAKTTSVFNICLGLIESGCKCIFVSNEQESYYLKQMLIAMVSSVVFGCYSITRKKVAHMDFTKQEEEVFHKANEFIKEKYTDKLKFLSVDEFNVSRILKMVKKLHLSDGYDTLILETFKSESAIDDSVNNMVENSRLLDKFGRQNKMRIITPIQLRSSNEGKVSYLTSSEIASSKQIKEVAGVVLLQRKISKDELDESNKKLFLKPYIWIKDSESDKYKKKYLKIKDSKSENESSRRRRSSNGDTNDHIDINKTYFLLFVNKNRFGSDDNQILLMELDGQHGFVKERCYVDHVYDGQLRY